MNLNPAAMSFNFTPIAVGAPLAGTQNNLLMDTVDRQSASSNWAAARTAPTDKYSSPYCTCASCFILSGLQLVGG